MLSEKREYIEKARFLATQARDEAPHYQHSAVGYNYRMSNIAGGIGRGQMEVLEKRIKQRRAVFNYYFEALDGKWQKADGRGQTGSQDSEGIYFLKEPEGYFSNRWLTTIMVNPNETNGVNRKHVRKSLVKQNIDSRPLWKPMHLQPVFEEALFYGKGISETLFKNGLCLPSGSNMNENDLNRVTTAVNKVLP